MRISLTNAVVLLASMIAALNTLSAADDAPSEFSSQTIDFGVVVSDVEASVKFYTEAIGATELKGFSVGGEFGKKTGLTDGRGLNIRVLALGNDKNSTKIKLMQVSGAPPKRGDTTNLISQYGFRYLTLYVTDTTAALARLQKAGVKPVSSNELPKELADGIFLTVVRDPDGNIVELVGPKK